MSVIFLCSYNHPRRLNIKQLNKLWGLLQVAGITIFISAIDRPIIDRLRKDFWTGQTLIYTFFHACCTALMNISFTVYDCLKPRVTMYIPGLPLLWASIDCRNGSTILPDRLCCSESDPSQSSVACAQTGVIKLLEPIAEGPAGEEVFSSKRSLIFK